MTKMSDKNHWLTASCDKIPQMQLCRAVMLKILCDSSDLLNPATKPHEEHSKYKSQLRWLNFKSKKTRNTKINPDLIPVCEAVELLWQLLLWQFISSTKVAKPRLLLSVVIWFLVIIFHSSISERRMCGRKHVSSE